MVLTPDRNSGKDGKRPPRAVPGESTAATEGSAAQEPENLFDQLQGAGFDLSANPLADRLGSLPAVPPAGDDEGPDAPASRRGVSEPDRVVGFGADDDQPLEPACSGEGFESATGSATESDCAKSTGVPHPLLSDSEWSDLERLAPELTQGIAALDFLRAEVTNFERPVGPDQAMMVVNGIETANRILEALSAATLSIFERCGTPTDYGAKNTKALVQDRLNITEREANRRTSLAKDCGNRVNMTGQSLGPVNPIVAEALHSGALSSGQASTINSCLENLPVWIAPDLRTKVESDLVEKASAVRVTDIRAIYNEILKRIDPDGTEPKLTDRKNYNVTLRSLDDGDWVLHGLLDPVTGGVLHGLLTSRLMPKDDTSVPRNGDNNGPETGALGIDAAEGRADDAAIRELFGAVLAGDRYDAPLPVGADDGRNGDGAQSSDDGIAPAGWGVREDGALVDASADQGTVRNRLYERFATVVSRIEMGRVGRGAPFSLVVTAKAEDIAEGKGTATSGSEADFPISTARLEGLNGSVFFHLMSEKTKTMELATENRYANRRQVAIITARDKGCTFPGCDAPPGWCDVHHVVPWADQGRTDVNNLMLVCGLHHHLIDKSEWETRMLRDGRPSWVPPSSIDVERRPILHARFVTEEIIEDLQDKGFTA